MKKQNQVKKKDQRLKEVQRSMKSQMRKEEEESNQEEGQANRINLMKAKVAETKIEMPILKGHFKTRR